MASRRLTQLLFTGGMDTLEDNSLNIIRPDLILSVHPYPGGKYGRHKVVESFIGHKDVPTKQQLQAWIDIGSTALLQLNRVLVMCNDGSQRSCTVAAVLLAAAQHQPITRVVSQLSALFQTYEQGQHVWSPYAHWYSAIVKQWGFLTMPAWVKPPPGLVKL